MRITLITMFNLLMLSILSSCGGGGGSSNSTNVQDKGDFKARAYESSYVGGYKEPFQKFGNALATELNRQYKLPSKDVQIIFKDCGIKNAFYNRNNSQVVMCYDLLFDMIASFDKTEDAVSAYVFVLMHELSHAFVHQMNLPIVGKEEDAVDSISTVLLIEDSKTVKERKDGAVATIMGGVYMYRKYQSGGFTWTDTHSIGPQRLFNLVCWAGAAEPSILSNTGINILYNQMVGKRNCKREYAQIKKSTIKLLSPYRKVGLGQKLLKNAYIAYPKLN